MGMVHAVHREGYAHHCSYPTLKLSRLLGGRDPPRVLPMLFGAKTKKRKDELIIMQRVSKRSFRQRYNETYTPDALADDGSSKAMRCVQVTRRHDQKKYFLSSSVERQQIYYPQYDIERRIAATS